MTIFIGLILGLLNLVLIVSHLEVMQPSPIFDKATIGSEGDSRRIANAAIKAGEVVVSPESAFSQSLISATSTRSFEKKQHSANQEAADDWDDQLQDNDIAAAALEATNTSTPDELADSKEPILRILRDAGITIDNETTLRELPSWSDVTRLYGSRPRILYGGVEASAAASMTCEAFRNHSDPAEHFIGTAGNFNSGTNLLSELLIANCQMKKRMEKYGAENKGIRWQVPWGKHSPPLDDEFRRTDKTKKGDAGIEAHNVLPVVTIRDPYQWMQGE